MRWTIFHLSPGSKIARSPTIRIKFAALGLSSAIWCQAAISVQPRHQVHLVCSELYVCSTRSQVQDGCAHREALRVSRFDDRRGQNNSIFGCFLGEIQWVPKRWSVLTDSERDIAVENAAVILNDPSDEFGYHRNCYKRKVNISIREHSSIYDDCRVNKGSNFSCWW